MPQQIEKHLEPTCTSQNTRNSYNKQKVNCSYNFQQNLCIHFISNLNIVIIIYNSPLERENVINKKILRNHVDNNVQMFYQPFSKFKLPEGQCGKGFFVFNIANVLDNGQLNKLHELKRMNQHQIVCGKLMSQFSDEILISRLFHGFRNLSFNYQLEKQCLHIQNIR